MKKRVVFKKYHYRECDSFADYLERMAAKGWIFKGWKLGLVFYKDQPRKESYAAEIFPEGDENDKRPEPNTQEYARYCEEAGWELVDSIGKFCVFRKIREDAVPIVTEEERYENVRKAEWKSFGGKFFLSCFMTALLYWRLGTFDYVNYIFSDLLLLWIFTWTVLLAGELFHFIGFIAWKVNSNHRMKQGCRVFYGGGNRAVHIWVGFRSLLYFIFTVVFLGAVAAFSGRNRIFIVLIVAVGFLIFSLVMAWIRPSREKNMLATLLFVCIFPVMVLAVSLGISEEKKVDETETGEQEEIVETAYGSGTVEIEDSIKGIFGEAVRYSIFLPEAEGEKLKDPYENLVVCYTYRSSRKRILNRIYDICIQDEEEPPLYENIWQALEAKQSNRREEMAVKYEDTVLYFIGKKDLNKDQILFIREALKL